MATALKHSHHVPDHPSLHQPTVAEIKQMALSGAPWMETAVAEYGQHRIKGEGDNARILQYFLATSYHSKSDEASWCSAFANWVMKQSGIQGSGKANARSWLNWGQTLPPDKPAFGAVTVLMRGNDPKGWMGHVSFFIKEEAGYLWLMGGNQTAESKVCVAKYKRSKLLGFRWPGDYPLPG